MMGTIRTLFGDQHFTEAFLMKILFLLVTFFMWSSLCFAQTDISRVDGERFPLVMYAVPGTDADFKKVRDMGVDYVHLYGMGFGADSGETIYYLNVKKYLDLAHKYQLRVMYDLDNSTTIMQGEKGLERIRNAVKYFKDHPALGFWYLADEPDITNVGDFSPAAFLPFYQILKTETPHIPVNICTTTEENPSHQRGYNWSNYDSVYDILSFDTYPVVEHPFPLAHLQAVTEFNKKAIAKGKPVMPILQIYNWNTIPSVVEDFRKAGRKVENLRYPTIQELRYWNFATLIQGARGLMYWSYMRSATVEGADATWLDTTLAPSIKEFRTFVDLVHPAHVKQVIDTGSGNAEYMAIWQKNNKRYLVLANGTSQARVVKADHVLQEFRKEKISPWWFTRADSVKSQNQTVSEIQLNPWEVIVWESK